MDGSGVEKRTIDLILVAIRFTILTVQSEIRPLLYKCLVDWDEIFRIAVQ